MTAHPTLTRSPLAQRALAIAERGTDLLRYLGPLPLPSGPVLVDGAGDTDWIVLDARHDPHLAAGQLNIPPAARRHVETIAARGLEFDAYFIGHELEPGTVAALRADPSKPLAWKEAGAALGPPPVDRRATKVVAATTKALAIGQAIAMKTGSALAAMAEAVGDISLDPVVFGAVTADGKPDPGKLAAFFYLVHWT